MCPKRTTDSSGQGRNFRRHRSAIGSGKCRRKFLRFFPQGFHDETYMAWERTYKVIAHHEWDRLLSRDNYASLLRNRKFTEIALRAIRIEARTNLIFSFEKMALRDAVKSAAGSQAICDWIIQFSLWAWR